MRPLVFVTGFGPFEDVRANPSEHIALALEHCPPSGVEVRSAVLPVSFQRAPSVWDERFRALCSRKPDLLLALGVQKASGFRIELRARAQLANTERPDKDGVVAQSGSPAQGPDLWTSLELEPLLARLRSLGCGPVWLSEDAGGYVCERLYRHVLERGAQNAIPALFVHVPRPRFLQPQRQVRLLRLCLEGLLERV